MIAVRWAWPFATGPSMYSTATLNRRGTSTMGALAGAGVAVMSLRCHCRRLAEADRAAFRRADAAVGQPASLPEGTAKSRAFRPLLRAGTSGRRRYKVRMALQWAQERPPIMLTGSAPPPAGACFAEGSAAAGGGKAGMW